MKLIFKLPIFSLLPRRCAFCGKVTEADCLICKSCEKSVSRIKDEICKNCGRENKLCSCKKSAKYYNGIAAPFYFEGVVRTGMHRFKFRKCPRNSEAYSVEMAKTVKQRFSETDFDFIVGIPMTKKSLKKRGYNQVALLAKGVSEILGIEHKENFFVKLYETEKQHGLSYSLRKGNLVGAYDVVSPEEVEGKTILLCDDVSTTGETLNEAAKMLWLYGAKEIYCIAVALTKQKKK